MRIYFISYFSIFHAIQRERERKKKLNELIGREGVGNSRVRVWEVDDGKSKKLPMKERAGRSE